MCARSLAAVHRTAMAGERTAGNKALTTVLTAISLLAEVSSKVIHQVGLLGKSSPTVGVLANVRSFTGMYSTMLCQV